MVVCLAFMEQGSGFCVWSWPGWGEKPAMGSERAKEQSFIVFVSHEELFSFYSE